MKCRPCLAVAGFADAAADADTVAVAAAVVVVIIIVVAVFDINHCHADTHTVPINSLLAMPLLSNLVVVAVVAPSPPLHVCFG